MDRETLPDGTLKLATASVQVTLRRLRRGAYLVKYTGFDDGSLSDAVLDTLTTEVSREGSLDVFIDAQDTEGVTTTVRETWTRWMQQHRARTSVTLLVASKFMQVTLNVAKHLSGFGRMVTLSDRPKFDAAVEAAAKAP